MGIFRECVDLCQMSYVIPDQGEAHPTPEDAD